MEGAETQTKTDAGEALRSQIAIRCAKAAHLLSSLKSSPDRRRLNAAIDDDDVSEKEMLKKEIGDLKMEVARERLKSRRMKLWGLSELAIQLVILLALSGYFFMLAFGMGAS